MGEWRLERGPVRIEWKGKKAGKGSGPEGLAGWEGLNLEVSERWDCRIDKKE